VELRSLKFFLTVYECRNISVAADRLGMNQPAVSKAIRRVEQELGVKLFEREPRGVAPTVFAELLAEVAREVDSNLGAAIRRIQAMRDASVGEIAVGAGGTWQEALLPIAVSQLTQRRPKAHVRIIPAAPETLLASLIKGELDLVLAPIDIPEAMAKKVRVEPLLENELIVIGRGDHPLLEKTALTIEDLKDQRWILPPGTFIRERFERGFHAHGLDNPIPTIECVDSACLFQIVASTDLLTFVAELRLRHRLHMNLARMPQNPINTLRTSGLILRKTSYVPPLAKELINEVRKVSRQESAR